MNLSATVRDETLDFNNPELCSNCTGELGSVFIDCTICKDPSVRLCLFCFSCCAELYNHKKGHGYRIVNVNGRPLFASPPGFCDSQGGPVWDARNEEVLLDCIQRYNLGNWEDIAAHISRADCAPSDAKTHYEKYYIHGRIGRESCSGFAKSECIDHSATLVSADDAAISSDAAGQYNSTTVLPKLIVSRKCSTDSRAACYKSSLTIAVDCCATSEATEGSSVDGTSAGCSSTAPWNYCQNSPPLRGTTLKQNPDDLKLIAYMPRRDDFEKEWNNEAESVISDLIVWTCPNDSEHLDLDDRLKLARIEMYLQEVRDRRRRKLLARDYDLVPKFLKDQKPKLHASGLRLVATPQVKAILKGERELADEMKQFSQFLKKADFDSLVSGVVKERALKERVKVLQKLKRKGVKTLGNRLKGFDLNNIPFAEASSEVIVRKRRRRKNHLRFSVTHQKTVSRFQRWRKYIASQAETATA